DHDAAQIGVALRLANRLTERVKQVRRHAVPVVRTIERDHRHVVGGFVEDRVAHDVVAFSSTSGRLPRGHRLRKPMPMTTSSLRATRAPYRHFSTSTPWPTPPRRST